jgi:hypothetical protein
MHRGILTSLGLVAAVVTVSATPTDRSAKLDLIEHLKQAPQILILGDSRGRQAQPSYVQRLTGLTAFNAAVTGGTAADAWVFTRYTEDLFAHQRRRYIWFVSAGLAGNLVNQFVETDPRSQRYLGEVTRYLSPQKLDVPVPMDTRYHADGSIADSNPSYSTGRAAMLKAKAARMVAQIRAQPPVAAPPDPDQFQLFEHLLGYMNSLGARPVIVFNPIYPTVLAELEKYGNPLATGSLRYLQSLHSQYEFVVVNAEDSRKWGGTDYNWTNPTHVDGANMRRMLRYIVAHSDGALK